jgi:exosortase/archaeosortase family protein
LLVTSVVAGQVFLRSPAARWLLVAAVLPLAVLRNGFRVFVIGELCVQRGPEMIDSYIHHHGGPIFFALSLVPFCALLWFLARRQQRKYRSA